MDAQTAAVLMAGIAALVSIATLITQTITAGRVSKTHNLVNSASLKINELTDSAARAQGVIEGLGASGVSVPLHTPDK